MRHLLIAVALVCVAAASPLATRADAQANELARNRADIALLCASAIDDVRFIDRKQLTPEDRKTYDHVEDLLRRVRLYLRERTQGGVLSGTLAQAQEAATLANELVRKYLKLDAYERLARQFQSGDRGAVTELSTWLSKDVERVTAYLEASGVRGTRWPRNGHSPAASAVTGRIIAACLLLHTQVAFEFPEPGPHLSVARQLLTTVADDALPDAFRRNWYLSVAGHLQGQLDLLGAVGHIHEAVQLFAGDADILVAAGSLYELLALPTTDIPRQPIAKTGNSDLTSMGNTRVAAAQRDLLQASENRAWARSRAEEYYRKALTEQPSHAEAHLRLGRVLQLAGQVDPAQQELRIAAKSDQVWVRYLAALFRGRIYEAEGQVDEAKTEYRTARQACPNCLIGALALSHALRKNGETEQAAKILDSALERDKNVLEDDPWWFYALGPLRHRNGLMKGLVNSLQ